MRGRISYYNEKTGVGVIVNLQKRTFEFRKASWHDRESIPTRGMYVDFRQDEGGRVVDCLESIYQELAQKYDIPEKEFWDSRDDAELKEVADGIRQEMITKNIDEIGIETPLDATMEITECFNRFYADALELQGRYAYLSRDDLKRQSLEYFRIKRFIQKAKSHLIATDSSTSPKQFAEIEQEIFNLEYQIAYLKKRMMIDVQEAFVEIFIEQQIDYLRTNAKINLDEDKMFEIKASLKKHDSQIKMWESRAATNPIARDKAEKLKAARAKLSDTLKLLFARHQALTGKKKSFEDANLNEFIHEFGFETKQTEIHDRLIVIINHVGWKFDQMLWEVASKSQSIQNNFYRNRTNGSYCAMTFLRAYLKPLNKNSLSKPDTVVYKYQMKFDSMMAHTVLVVSDSATFSESARLVLFETHKDILVHTFSRAVESLMWMQSHNPKIIILDASTKTLTPIEYMSRYFTSHSKDGDAEFIVLTSDLQNDALRKLRTLGANHFCSKPINTTELKHKVLEILDLEDFSQI